MLTNGNQVEIVLRNMSFQESPRTSEEEGAFYMQCRAAYLAVFKSSLTNISSKQQLCLGKLTSDCWSLLKSLLVRQLLACQCLCPVGFPIIKETESLVNLHVISTTYNV